MAHGHQNVIPNLLKELLPHQSVPGVLPEMNILQDKDSGDCVHDRFYTHNDHLISENSIFCAKIR